MAIIWFSKLEAICVKEGILLEDIWNMDETGFQIRVRKDQLVITKRKRARYLGIPTNRESAITIKAISTSGQYIPTFLILSGLIHLARWYKVPELHDDIAICVSTIGYSNDQASLD